MRPLRRTALVLQLGKPRGATVMPGLTGQKTQLRVESETRSLAVLGLLIFGFTNYSDEIN